MTDQPRHYPKDLKELAALLERLKAEAPKVERDETATVLTLDEYEAMRGGEA